MSALRELIEPALNLTTAIGNFSLTTLDGIGLKLSSKICFEFFGVVTEEFNFHWIIHQQQDRSGNY